jgi:hypothetical protein
MQKLYFLLLACLCYVSINAQQPSSINIEVKDENGRTIYSGPYSNQLTQRNPNSGTGGVGIGTSTPSGNAILELQSTSKGLLLPRMSDADMRAIVAPEEGLLVYNTTYHRMFYKSNDCWRSVGQARAFVTFVAIFPTQQPFLVPDCVSQIEITAYGAKGKKASLGALGGNGAVATGKLNTVGGEILYITCGDSLGFNGGAPGGNGGAGNGGGASDVRLGGTALANRILVAGGGGGGGSDGCNGTGGPGAYAGGVGGSGGSGTGSNGQGSSNGPGGSGGQIGVGGLANNLCNALPGTNGANSGQGGDGSLLTCLVSSFPGGGGGGGGFVTGGGGGGGSAFNSSCSGTEKGGGGGGAGGSNYFAPSIIGGVSNAGINANNGLVVITYLLPN